MQHKIQSQAKLSSTIRPAAHSTSAGPNRPSSAKRASGNASVQLGSTSAGRARISRFAARPREEKTASTDFANTLSSFKPQRSLAADAKQSKSLKQVFQDFGLSKRLLPSKLPGHFSSFHFSAATAVPTTPTSFRLSNKPPPLLYEKLRASRADSPPLNLKPH